ncbi:glycosyltransferase involved in cell wall biosynthesis [Nocardia ignorata]|uniref:Glycosyltransferase involved in cell wall biosynthesis n=2 Tax=Nocardia ignorata TaxID=145285 RepID=A0A4R6PMN2_NOCIG|nr:glycosyltransferase involved in cell wall biosynthesis [Nocardia ignorata]
MTNTHMPRHIPGVRRANQRGTARFDHAANGKNYGMISPRRILLWHVHGSWTTAFVQGPHRYLLPVTDERGPWGLGRCGRDWPNTEEVTVGALRDIEVDVIVLQRPEEIELAHRWLGRRPGVDIPAVYVEHNTPRPSAALTTHPMAERSDIPVVHVTHFNEVMWDNGTAPTRVIPHGIVDPGELYTGELPHGVALINEPMRRGRITGSDLLTRFAREGPVDLYGIGAQDFRPQGPTAHPVNGIADLRQSALHPEMAKRRVYLHTARWTSLGLSLLEAMHLGMPVVALATTEAVSAVPPEAGALSTDVTALTARFRELLHEPDLAVLAGKSGRQFALEHYGLESFLHRWDGLLAEITE